VRTITRKRKN